MWIGRSDARKKPEDHSLRKGNAMRGKWRRSICSIFLIIAMIMTVAGCDARQDPGEMSPEQTPNPDTSEAKPIELRRETLSPGSAGPKFMELRTRYSTTYRGEPIDIDFQYDKKEGSPGVKKGIAWFFVDGIPVPIKDEDGITTSYVSYDYSVIGELLHKKISLEPLTGKKGDQLALMIPVNTNAFLDFPPGDPNFLDRLAYDSMLGPPMTYGIVMEADAKEGDLTFRQETAKAQAITKELKIKYCIDEDALEHMTEKEIDAMVIQGPRAQLRMNDAKAMVLQKPEDYTKNTWELALVGPNTIYGEGNFRLSLLKNYEQIPFGDCDYIDVKLEPNKLTLVPIHFPDIEYKDKDVLRVMVAPRDTVPEIFEEGATLDISQELPNVFGSWLLYTWTGKVPESLGAGSN